MASSIGQTYFFLERQGVANEILKKDLSFIESLEKHLETLVNPYVTWLLLDLLKKIREGSSVFTHVLLPEESEQALKALEGLPERPRQAAIESIYQRWTPLNDLKLQGHASWSQLELLLTLGPVMKLSPAQAKELLDLIEKGDKRGVRSFFLTSIWRGLPPI